MIFNSIEFAIFLPIVFVLYWSLATKHITARNIFLIIASYVFYGWWDWRFLSLIFFSSLVDFLVGMGLSKTGNLSKRKLLLFTSICINLGFLGVFKYFNFFAQSFSDAFTLLGTHIEPTRLNIILPIGISFYTFQTLSYSIDIYKKKLDPSKCIFAFFAFVSFFPQLVAGPIERATNLLPQFYKRRTFEYEKAVDGMRQILWGLLKKIVIADNCAEYVNPIFNNPADYSGSTLVLGAVLFTFQIYGDFSGYSDIAIGTARLFGFNLMRNFAFPYFSRDIAEFWRRWHISLSTWFRDYLYIPLGGSQGGTREKIRNTFTIFIISGLWHGANWTFVIWGALNAIYFLPLLLRNKNRINIDTVAQGHSLPTINDLFNIGITFSLTVFAWIFFRAENLEQAIVYISGIASSTLFSFPEISPRKLVIGLGLFILVEWFGRENQYAIATLGHQWSRPKRWVLYYIILIMIAISHFDGSKHQFIYFQF